jgi:hypothetical protein
VTTPAQTCLGGDSDASETITESFKSHMAGDTTERVVFPYEDPSMAFNAPVTEVMPWFFPLSMMKPEFTELVPGNFIKFAKRIAEAPEHVGRAVGGWGKYEVEFNGQRCRSFTGFIGWKSVEAHQACKTTPPFKNHIHLPRHPGNAGLEMKHFALSSRL